MDLPVKPTDVTWTDEQWKAIHASGKDILVAAAAGSGKTAVLVERIIQKVINEKNPINIDEILVATFTNASAAEMRHRVGLALEKEIRNNPASHHLRKQLSLLNNASISTLHSFCLNVVHKYYYLIDIDPGFRIADETESLLLKDEAVEALLEEEYGKEDNEAFYRVVDIFTKDRTDQDLADLILKLYEFSRANPDPDRWLNDLVSMYDIQTDQVDQLPFIEPLLFDIELQMKEAKRLFNQALDLTREPGGPAPRAENFEDDIRIADQLLQAKSESFQALYDAIQTVSFSRLKSCRGDEYIKELVDQATELRNKGKKLITALKEDLFSRKPETFLNDLKEMKEPVSVLARLVRDFSEKLQALKREKGLVDFSDLEHFALNILGKKDEQTGELIPTEAAFSYRKQFKEVLIDEYQDTNMVQEMILQLIKQPSEEAGNLFMVGDVKQSIYRFRLAEPKLFMDKYHRFTPSGEDSGLRIDLAKNFRSRKEVLDGTNFLFKQIMGTTVGEIDYDEAAELKLGASYPQDRSYPIELTILYKDSEDEPTEAITFDDGTESAEVGDFFSKEELEQSEMESQYVADQIRYLIDSEKQVYDPKTNTYRTIQYKDIVILLRSFKWAPQFLEAFKERDIPSYANISTGYFEAAEVATMLSLLKIIDNPYQDIPIAAVLRSPMVGLNEEHLARIRIFNKRVGFYEAVQEFAKATHKNELDEYIQEKLVEFLSQLNQWRTMARQDSLSNLIWQIYRDTYFYDYVGGLPGGKQRQANLRALYDRARGYESTSFRGLFRFLRFIERMKERGDDLGVAPALGEQEDVVRIMTIHSSKGLEFPVVFVCGLARQFNMMDLNKPYLFDKEFGFATNYVNPEKQISYPSLIYLSVRRKKRLELVAEEMRVLYVALTRAKEKLYLVGSTKNVDKLLEKWQKHLEESNWLLSDYDRKQSTNYLDWVGPAVLRHRNGESLRLVSTSNQVPDEIIHHPSEWRTALIPEDKILESLSDQDEDKEDLLHYVSEGKEVPIQTAFKEQIANQLLWKYPYQTATVKGSKQSVSEIKRMREIRDAETGDDLIRPFKKPIVTRPKFMQEKTLTPAEKGTAMHMVMQHINLSRKPTKDLISSQVFMMVEKELLTREEAEIIDVDAIVQFFETEIGRRLLNAENVQRELPFSLAIDPSEIYSDWEGNEDIVFIQGIIDCLFRDDQGLVLLDYKTDQITERFPKGFEQAKPVLINRYETQINLYRQAVEKILQEDLTESYLFFFDGAHLLKIQ